MHQIIKRIELNGKSINFSKQSLYNPVIGDTVIGKVIFVGNEFYKINLFNFSTNAGILPILSFKNATKRNRPNLNANDVIIAKVVSIDFDILLSCEENFLGVLPISSQKTENEGKVLMQIFPYKCKMLYFTDILEKIGKDYEFEILIGLNGVIWLNSEKGAIKKIGEKLFEFNNEN